MTLLSSISSSLSGMKVAQAQLEIVSNNIANVDTEGYTRKTAAQATHVVTGVTMGVNLHNTQRTVDEGLLKNFLTSNALSASLENKHSYLSQLDNLMGTTEGQNSLAANIANLQSAFETFSTTVTSPASRYQLLSTAQTAVSKLNYLSENIQTLRGNADMQINDAVGNINSLLHSIDALNVDIVKYTVLGRDGVANLQDQRDMALRELSTYIDITYYTRDTGSVVIQTSAGTMLLDNNVHELSHSALAQVGADNSYDSGNIQGIFVDGKDITKKLSGGVIGGLVEIRDKTLPSLQSQLDEISYILYSTVNEIHNQGTAYPNMPYELTGSQTFIADSSGAYMQNIRIDEGDVRLIVFDEEGNQFSTGTLVGDMGFSQGSISTMMSTIEGWLQNTVGLSSAEVYMDGNGHLVMKTGDSSYTLSIIDEASSNAGSTQENVTISFDVDGSGVFDAFHKTTEGFSSFFGLNDFFTTGKNDYIYDSKVVNLRTAVGADNTVWTFVDSVNGLSYSGNSINITKSMTIKDIAEAINSNDSLNTHIKASLIANGDGYMLRIESLEGAQLEIAESGTGGVLEKLNMQPSNCGYSANISIREDIVQNANLIVNSSPDFDITKGAYTINGASNNIANKLAASFTQVQTFKQSGDMAKTVTTLANYTSTFVGNIASLTNTAEESYTYQQALTDAISYKEAQVSGIDLDEELSQMIIYQKSYAACAQVFSASKDILDILLNVI